MCFCRRFGAVYDCYRLGTTCDCCRLNAILFVCKRLIQTSKVYPINNNKSNQ